MGITAETGPIGTFGAAQSADFNASAGPSFFYQGGMILDPRAPYTYQPGQRTNQPTYGWPMGGMIPVIDQIPSTASATNIAGAQVPVAGTPLTLVSSSGGGVTIGCTLTNSNGVAVTGALGLDVAAARTATGTFTNGSAKITFSSVNMFGVQVGDRVTLTTSNTLPTPFALSTTYYVVAITEAMMMLSATVGGAPIAATSGGTGTQTINVTAPGSYYATAWQSRLPFQPECIFGQGDGFGGPLRYWNPQWALSRTILITSAGNDTAATFLVSGYDIYGYPMSQRVTGASGATASTTKAFKYITSVTPAGTLSGSNVSIGTNDVFGLPLRCDMATMLQVNWGNTPPALIAVGSLTFVAADITTPNTLTGDVRGTVYGGSASDGTKRLQVLLNVKPTNWDSTVGLLGQTQA